MNKHCGLIISSVLIFMCLILLLSACIAKNIAFDEKIEAPPSVLISNVPFIKQKPYYCAAAAAEMVLRYHGIEHFNQDDIAACDAENKTGTHWRKLVNYINIEGKKYDTAADIILGDLELLKKYLASGHPVLVRQWQDKKKRYKHYRVVIGYHDAAKLVYFHDPQIRSSMSMEYEEFTRLWDIRDSSEKWTSKNLMIIIGKKTG